MTDPLSSDIPRRWRDARLPQSEEAFRRARRRAWILGFVLAALTLTAGMLVVIYRLQPLPRPVLVSVVIAPDALTDNDRLALASEGWFRPWGNYQQLPTRREQVEAALAGLDGGPSGARLVHFAGPIEVVGGDVRLTLPDGGQVRLREILRRLAECPESQKLLILDVGQNAEAGQAAIQALEQITDPSRLTFMSASPSEIAHASEELGRTVFGHYLDAGLRGYADGYNDDQLRDGRVTVRELASFVTARVYRWSKRNRTKSQTPVLYGDGDFELVPLDQGKPRPPRELPLGQNYPDWLSAGWAKRDAWRTDGTLRIAPELVSEAESALLKAELDWRGGRDAQKILARELRFIDERLAGLRNLPTLQDPPTLWLAGVKPTGEHLALLGSLLSKVKPTTGTSAEPPADVQARLPEQSKALALPHPQLAAAVFEWLCEDRKPTPERVKYLRTLLETQQPRPKFVETLLVSRLGQLADLGTTWPREAVRQILDVIRQEGRLYVDPQGFSWLEPLLNRVAAQRHRVEMLLFSPGYADSADLQAAFEETARALSDARRHHEIHNNTQEILSDARATLLAKAPYLTVQSRLLDRWYEAVRLTTRLTERLKPPALVDSSPDALRTRLGEWLLDAELIRQSLAELRRPFTTGLSELRKRSTQPDAGATVLSELDAVLSIPLLTLGERVQTLMARSALAGRLNDATLALDSADDASRQLTPLPSESASQREQARELLVASRRIREQMAESRRSLEAIPTQDQRAESAARFAWLIRQYRYEANASTDPGDGELGASFYSSAGRALLPLTESVDEEPFIQLLGPSPGPALTVNNPKANYPLRLTLVDKTGTKAETIVRFTQPRNRWLEPVAPLAVTLLPLTDFIVQVPLQAGLGSGPVTDGLIAEVAWQGRVFHRRIPVRLGTLADRIEVLFAATGAKAAPQAIGELRLRNSIEPLSYSVYLRNPATRTRQVIVRVFSDGVLLPNGESAKTPIPAGETKLITLGPPVPATSAASTTPAPPAAANKTPELPVLNGPLEVRVYDAESADLPLIETTPLRLEVANPREYVRLTEARYIPATAKSPNRLGVELRLVAGVSGPVPVELELPRDRIPALRTVESGKFKGELSEKSPTLLLYAEDIRLIPDGPEEGYAYIHVDGVPRAFVLRTTFAASGEPTRPTVDTDIHIRLRTKLAAAGGAEIPYTIETDNAPLGTRLQIKLGRGAGAAFFADVTTDLPTPRLREVRGGVAAGGLQVRAILADWAGNFSPGRVLGPRLMRATLLDRGGREVLSADQPVLLDGNAPRNVRFVDLPPKASKDAPLTVRAVALPGLSGVQEMQAYLGKPVKDRPPQGAKPAVGKPINADRTTWEATLPAVAAVGPQEVSVTFVNGVGEASSASGVVEFVDPAELAKLQLGAIEGTVSEGEFVQKDLPVILTDEKGKELAKTQTDADGKFRFDKLPAGKYTVRTAKPTTNRKGEKKDIEVKPGETTSVAIPLYL